MANPMASHNLGTHDTQLKSQPNNVWQFFTVQQGESKVKEKAFLVKSSHLTMANEFRQGLHLLPA
jgi:hypothetical protein